LVKWEGYELHRSTWEPRKSFVDVDCLVNWKLHKHDIDAGRAKPFNVAKFEAAVKLNNEQRERRLEKRAEKRRQKEGLPPRRRLLAKKELIKKGTARKAPTRDSSTPSSATERSPRRQATPLFEPSAPTGSDGRKRKRLLSGQRSPSPALSVNDVSNSQYSMFNDTETTSKESPRKSPSSRSTTTTVPKRARVNDPSKQRLGMSSKGIDIRTPALQQPGAKAVLDKLQIFLILHQVKVLNIRHARTQSFSTNNCGALHCYVLPCEEPSKF
jgi:hypothetical protein